MPPRTGHPDTTTAPNQTRSAATSSTRALFQSSAHSLSRLCRHASMKRKRPSRAGGPRKKAHVVDQSTAATLPAIDQPVLRRYYPQLLTLRHYLLSQLPKSSRNRRRKISQLGLQSARSHATPSCDPDTELGQLLDSTVIGGFNTSKTISEDQVTKERNRDIDTFTQQLSPVITGGTFKPGYFLQSEVGRDGKQKIARAAW